MASTSLALIMVLWGEIASGVSMATSSRSTWRRSLGEGVLCVGLEGILGIVRVMAKWHQLTGGRLRAAWEATVAVIARVGHHAGGRIGIGLLRDVVPAGARMARRRTRAGGMWISGVVVRVVVAFAVVGVVGVVDVDGLGPLPAGAVIARQCGSAAAPVAGRGV